MSKVFTSKEWINKLKWLVSLPTHYSSQYWSVFRDNAWQFDCVRSVKAILWGFKADKKLVRGGTVYLSNGVPDFTCNGALNYCKNVSRDFTKLTPGAYLCMKGTKYNHTGIYLGNNEVFECTTAWGTKKCIISTIDKYGNRYYKGVKSVPWTYHGLLNYIDYSDQEEKVNQVKVLQSKLNEQWNCGLAVDGSFGPATTKACSEHLLKKWIKAPIMVKWLQTRLTELKYSVSKAGIDGSFGNDTEKAVKQFQKDKKLKIDGIVGKNTYKALSE